jgi:hypothetical protein
MAFIILWLPGLATSKNFLSRFQFVPKSKIRNKLETHQDQSALHPIHLAFKIRADLDSGAVNCYAEAGKIYNLSRARVYQLLKLLKLPDHTQEFLIDLRNPKLIRKYGEHHFRMMKKDLDIIYNLCNIIDT